MPSLGPDDKLHVLYLTRGITSQVMPCTIEASLPVALAIRDSMVWGGFRPDRGSRQGSHETKLYELVAAWLHAMTLR